MADVAETLADGTPVTAGTRPRPPVSSGAPLSVWQTVSLHAVRAVVRVLLALLSLRGLYRFGQIFGTLEWLISARRRRRFLRELRRVLGREPTRAERRGACRAYFMQSRCDKLVYLILDCLPRERASGLLRITKRELLDRALERGRGVYIAMAHHGAHHVLAALTALNGYLVAGVRDPNEAAVRRFVQARLARKYPDLARLRMMYSDTYPREIYRCLQEGYLLASAMDIRSVRDQRQAHEPVTIFGEQRDFLIGPLRIAMRCQVPVIQGFVYAEPDFHYCLDLVEVLIDPDKPEEESAAIRAAIRRYAANVERIVRETPSLISRI